jgi:hypothetical protein
VERNPDSIENDIGATRDRIGDTVEAIAYKADVPSRAKDAVNQKVDAVKGAVASGIKRVSAGAKDTASNAADALDAARSSAGDAAAYAKNLPSMAADNPIGLALGALAIGFLAGLLMPVSAIERERVGQVGEQLLENAQDAAGAAMEQGKAAALDVATETISSIGKPSTD